MSPSLLITSFFVSLNFWMTSGLIMITSFFYFRGISLLLLLRSWWSSWFLYFFSYHINIFDCLSNSLWRIFNFSIKIFALQLIQCTYHHLIIVLFLINTTVFSQEWAFWMIKYCIGNCVVLTFLLILCHSCLKSLNKWPIKVVEYVWTYLLYVNKIAIANKTDVILFARTKARNKI